MTREEYLQRLIPGDLRCMTAEERHEEAWKRVCTAYNAIPEDPVDKTTFERALNNVFEVIDDCMIVFGDPTKEQPLGIMEAETDELPDCQSNQHPSEGPDPPVLAVPPFTWTHGNGRTSEQSTDNQ